MILSCLTTANNLLAIAAAEMTVRMVNLKRAGNGVGELDLASRRSRGYGGGHGREILLSNCGCKTMSSCGVVVRS